MRMSWLSDLAILLLDCTQRLKKGNLPPAHRGPKYTYFSRLRRSKRLGQVYLHVSVYSRFQPQRFVFLVSSRSINY